MQPTNYQRIINQPTNINQPTINQPTINQSSIDQSINQQTINQPPNHRSTSLQRPSHGKRHASLTILTPSSVSMVLRSARRQMLAIATNLSSLDFSQKHMISIASACGERVRIPPRAGWTIDARVIAVIMIMMTTRVSIVTVVKGMMMTMMMMRMMMRRMRRRMIMMTTTTTMMMRMMMVVVMMMMTMVVVMVVMTMMMVMVMVRFYLSVYLSVHPSIHLLLIHTHQSSTLQDMNRLRRWWSLRR